MKALIIYYSRSGATEALARLIARLTGGELCRVQPAEPYSDDYRATVERAKAELAAGAAIGLAGRLPDVTGFDAVLAGTPNWCGLMAPPVSSALARLPLEGKLLAPFCTNGGGGFGRIEVQLAALCPGARLLPGYQCRRADEEAVRAWLAGIDLL